MDSILHGVALKWIYHDHVISTIWEELKENQMVVWGGFHYNNRLAGEELLSLLEQGDCSVYRCFIVINFSCAKILLSGDKTHISLNRLLTSIPATGQKFIYTSPLRAVSLLRKSNRRVIDTGNGCADPTNQNIDSFMKRTDGLRC